MKLASKAHLLSEHYFKPCHCITAEPDLSIVGSDDLLNNGQPQTSALTFTALGKSFKNMGGLFGRNLLTVILD